MWDDVASRFARLAADAGVDQARLRVVRERTESVSVRQDVLQPVGRRDDLGAMVTVVDGAGSGYAATPDLSDDGLRWALERATLWARATAERGVVDHRRIPAPRLAGDHRSPVQHPLDAVPLKTRVELARAASAKMKLDPRLVDWTAELEAIHSETLQVDASGARAFHAHDYVIPHLSATAHEGDETQTRSLSGRGVCRQAGAELLDALGFVELGAELSREALELLAAPDCPSERMALLLDADQMMLQIHESIGHPLELDRILGDERNYAGTSFVTLEMFGQYRYGSELLNVSFDPTVPDELASYPLDDDGRPAERALLIEAGVLKRPLGGTVSEARSGLPGVANARATSWNRAPIDRMANLNVEPGDQSFAQLVAGIERGVYMRSNCSWSIDDSRNKFQFGCEWGRLIEDGELTTVVKKPNYRGISAEFWRKLVAVGDRSTFTVLGTPFCGKGEPNQVIRVGHASPACVFADVDVFGGD
jgi:predicted Zn-dependent protease